MIKRLGGGKSSLTQTQQQHKKQLDAVWQQQWMKCKNEKWGITYTYREY